MAKTNINFNNKNYLVDDTTLSSATTELQLYFSNVMNGSGSTIKVGGTSYNIDSTKLENASNELVSYIGTVAGSGYDVTVNGVKYSFDSAKMQNAVTEIEAVLGGLHSEDGGNGDLGNLNEYGFYYNTKYSTCNTDGVEFSFYFKENQTMDVCTNGVCDETVSVTYSNEKILVPKYRMTLYIGSDGREITVNGLVYKIGDSVIVDEDYTYRFHCITGSYGEIQRLGWHVYVNDQTKSNYGAIRSDILEGYPLYLNDTFRNCTNLTTAPEIPLNVVDMSYAFIGCENLATPPSVIPESVKRVYYAFGYCTSLTGTIEFEGDPLDCHTCFYGTEKSIVITGSCSDETKATLASSSEKGNVTY